MLDIKFIREHTEEVRQNLKNRHAQVDLDALLEADARRRELLGQVEAMKNRRNDVTKEISVLKRNKENADEKIAAMKELGDEIGSYSQLFKTAEEIEQEIAGINDALFEFDRENAEVFRHQIEQIADKKQLLALKKALQTARELYNVLRLQDSHEFLERLDFDKLNLLYREAVSRLDTLNIIEKQQQGNIAHLLNEALEDVYFQFVKISEAELKLAYDLKDIMRKVREGLASNFDQQDPEYISLREELERIFKKKNLAEVGQEEMQANGSDFGKLATLQKELDEKNEALLEKYERYEYLSELA